MILDALAVGDIKAGADGADDFAGELRKGAPQAEQYGAVGKMQLHFFVGDCFAEYRASQRKPVRRKFRAVLKNPKVLWSLSLCHGKRRVRGFRHSQHFRGAPVAGDIETLVVKREPDGNRNRIQDRLSLAFCSSTSSAISRRRRAIVMLVLTRASSSCALNGLVK